MRYLHNPKRQSPELVLSGARNVIVCGMNYNTPLPYSTEARAALECGGLTPLLEGQQSNHDTEPGHGRDASNGTDASDGNGEKRRQAAALHRGWISRYAWGADYHEVLGQRLEKLVVWMHREFPEPHQSLWYVDTGPIVERVAAKWAGLGWLGKNTCLINKDWGSWLFLGVVITTLDLEPSLGPALRPVEPLPDLCGQCTLCIDACPTGAIVEPYVLDARRCISYLTIELRGAIPQEFHGSIGWHIFGCDICQDVCPFNRKAPVTDKHEFQPKVLPTGESLFAPPLMSISAMAAEHFEQCFANSAIRRTKHTGLARNAALAQRNAAKE
jgi:epoxyqueuosine reductase